MQIVCRIKQQTLQPRKERKHTRKKTYIGEDGYDRSNNRNVAEKIQEEIMDNKTQVCSTIVQINNRVQK